MTTFLDISSPGSCAVRSAPVTVTDTLELALKASALDHVTIVHRPRLLSDNGSPVRGKAVLVRFQPDELRSIDGWAVHQTEPLRTRPEAIRRLVELGLTVAQPHRAERAERRAYARKAADAAIDKAMDGEPAEAKAEAKRLLTKGPKRSRET